MTSDRSQPTERDVGKPIVDSDDNQVGLVADVTGNEIEVDPDPDMLDRAKARFGWKDRDDDTYRLDADRIRTVTDDEVVVRVP
ncbi:PRC-barrel domain containing protein [Natronoarchaeum mannanilyticum]|uniref:PRC-barrel domain containing protein n=1 Tax=Natronoarchaeum mannanilyticum TaxID=926360 RepID=A0AAV3TD32_9EURY